MKEQEIVSDYLNSLLPDEEPSVPPWSDINISTTTYFHPLQYRIFTMACKDLGLSKISLFNALVDRVIIGAYGKDIYKELNKVILTDRAARQKNKELRYVEIKK